MLISGKDDIFDWFIKMNFSKSRVALYNCRSYYVYCVTTVIVTVTVI